MNLDLPTGARVVVAMSGGVDSSVAAALMVEAGFEVIGMTLQLYDQGAAAAKKGACCAGQDIYDARRVCDKLGIPHYVLDYESRFSQAVIEDFADSYLRGETPIPCVRCNQQVKFKDLLATARELGGAALITGHYVQRLQGEAGAELHRAVDLSRDQSYFLFATTQAQLDFLRFPLGGMPKADTRAHALRFELEIADKPDSQDICFVPNGSYVSVLEKLRPGALESGDIVHVDGQVIGQHKGIVHYTIGQRKGLNSGGGAPLYVIRLDPQKHQVIVGPYEALARTEMDLKEVNLLGTFTNGPLSCDVRVRSTRPPVPATLYLEEGGHARVVFSEPQYGIAAGQACVFYQGSRTLGGGWILREDPPSLLTSAKASA